MKQGPLVEPYAKVKLGFAFAHQSVIVKTKLSCTRELEAQQVSDLYASTSCCNLGSVLLNGNGIQRAFQKERRTDIVTLITHARICKPGTLATRHNGTRTDEKLRSRLNSMKMP